VGTLVFAGTAAFAVPALRRLVSAGHTISGVLTQPDRPVGRGHEIQKSPIKRAAMELGIAVHQPATLKDAAAQDLFKQLRPDALVVVAYGRILPPWLIEFPRYGAINLHGSLLPKYRGAAPIQWAVANGEAETGVCTMKIDEGLDTGPVYLCEKTPIDPHETVQQLTQRLAEMGSELLCRTLEGLFAGTLTAHPQNSTLASAAPVLKKQDGFIDWAMTATDIHNRVRAFQPWPGAVTQFRDTVCKVVKSRVASRDERGEAPGTIDISNRTLFVVCGKGTSIELLEVQLPNRKPCSGNDLVNGLRIVAGEKFENLRL
jgi:methionyl-tRNA formyltransferase